MAVKVLVVDDSGFFRRRVSEILSADPTIQVVGTATNGKEAIDQALALKPDVIAPSNYVSTGRGFIEGTAIPGLMQLPPGYSIAGGTSTATPTRDFLPLARPPSR